MNLIPKPSQRLYNLQRAIVLSVALLLLTISQAFAQPQISSLSPAAAAVGSSVVITGSGFSSTLSDNIVWFGPVRASVLSANPNSLTVTVPAGASFQPVTVSVANLTCASPIPFITTFAGCPNLGDDFFNPKLDIGTESFPTGTAAADLDGDGRVDLITLVPGSFSVYRNTSTPGNLTFASKVDFPVTVNNNAYKILCSDINGDGKMDVIVSCNYPYSMLVIINSGSPGNLSFAAPVSFPTNYGITDFAVSDLDADGLPDLVLGVSNFSVLFTMKNTSTGAVPNFANPTALSIGFMSLRALLVDDFNKDGKPDIVTLANNGQFDSVFVFTNNSGIGAISFLQRLKFSNGLGLGGIALVSGDLDADGFPDLAIVNNFAASVSLLMNTGSAAINFRDQVELSVSGTYSAAIAMADINGDGLPDIATGDPLYGRVSIFRNMSSQGNFQFSPKVDFNANPGTLKIINTDFDGDGKTDLASGNASSNTISIFRTASSRQTFLVDASKTNNTPVGLCTVTSQDWNNACNDLQAVINAAQPGDRIWVAAGSYYPSADASGNSTPADPTTKTFSIKNGMSLYGGFRGVETSLQERLPGQPACILNGRINSGGNTINVNTVVSFSNCDSSTVLSDFTVTGGSAGNNKPGGGFRLLQSLPVISNCIVSANNAAGHGAAFYLEDSHASIINCRITGNTALYGAAVDLVRSDAKIINCTIAKNAADTAAGLLLENGSAPVIANSIIWGNINLAGKQDNLAPVSDAVVSYSMIALESGVYPGNSNMNANPIFADAANDVFSPMTGSPAIRSGSQAAYPSNGPQVDILGNLVVDQGFTSIGAYQAAVDPVTNAAKVFYVNQHSTALFPTGKSWSEAFSNLNDALIVSNLSGLVKEIWVAKGTYTPTHGLTGMPVSNSNLQEATFLVRRIKMFGGFAGNETSPNQRNLEANTTLLDGFVPNSSGGYRLAHVVRTIGPQDVTIDGFSIARGSGDGFYGGGSLLADHNPIVINNCKIFDNRRAGGLWIYGAPATVSNTEFWDNNAGNGGALYVYTSTLNISNCYFHDNITIPSGGYPMNAGAAVYNAAAKITITNSRFERNAVDADGAAIYNSNSVYDSAITSVKNCQFNGNLARTGSAVYNLNGRISLVNCIVTGNKDNSTIGSGSVYNYSGILQVINTTVTNNTAANCGGIVTDGTPSFPSSTIIKNSIVWGNKSTDDAAHPNLFNNWTRYNLQWFTANNADIGLVSGIFPGAGNLNTDPKFVDSASINLNLLAGSPCINTGDNASYNGNLATDTTLDGIARLMGDTIEMGAMEYIPAKISNGRLDACASYSPVIIDGTNNNTWVPLTDSDGNLVAEIKANGNNLGTVDFGLFVRNAAPREDAAGRLYLNRNVIINPAVQPATPVDLRIYITRAEFLSLRTAVNSKGVASGVDSINDIAFYKNETHLCTDVLQAATSVVPVTGKLYANGYALTASIPSFSAFYMAAAAQSSLPLSLLSFSGRQVSGNITLNWVTTNETNTRLFSIEKSRDGNHFESIGKLQAKNIAGENNYFFIDTAAFSGTVVYYRLKQIDLDGKFVYSHVIVIRGVNNTNGVVTVFPNPVKDVIQLQLQLPVRQQVEWMITDNVGRTVQRGKIAAPAGLLTTPIIPHGLTNGVYYLVLKGNSFEQKVKLVKID